MNCKFDCETDEECEYQCSTGLVVQMLRFESTISLNMELFSKIVFCKLRKSLQQVSGRMPLLPFMS